MAEVQYDSNPEDWDTFDTTLVLDDGYMLWFKNHPDSSGVVQMIGDGSTQLQNLPTVSASGAKYLTPNRIADQEKTTTLSGTITGWVTVAQVDNGESVDSCSGEVTVVSSLGYMLSCEYAFRPGTSARTFENVTLKIRQPSGASANFDNIVNFRFAKSDTSTTAGYKLQVYVITEGELTVQLRGNISRDPSYAGMYLPDAIAEDTPLLPDGSTASYLEAGTELVALTNNNWGDPRITCFCHSTTSLRITIMFKDDAKQNASTITFPTGFSFYTSSGGLIYTVTAGDTVSVIDITENMALGNLSTTGLTINESGIAVGTDMTAELS